MRRKGFLVGTGQTDLPDGNCSALTFNKCHLERWQTFLEGLDGLALDHLVNRLPPEQIQDALAWLGRELHRMGYEVTVCPDGLTAVAALEINTYDCLLVEDATLGEVGVDHVLRRGRVRDDPVVDVAAHAGAAKGLVVARYAADDGAIDG